MLHLPIHPWHLTLLLACCLSLAGSSAANPLAARVALGWQLLAERRLALRGDLACLDCHQPERGYTDGRSVATEDGINTPTLYALAGRSSYGWFTPDVRSLEAFVLRPLDNPREMGPISELPLERLRSDPAMQRVYAAAFPDAPTITWEATAQALAAAIRSLATPATTQLSPAAQRGQVLFAELGCASCHHGPTLSSEAHLYTGVSANPRAARVPALVALAQTGPYFHDGSATTLTDVVRFYQRGGNTGVVGVSRGISPLLLTEAEVEDLVAFLQSR
ncbi:di-heme Cytochrome-c peroxidase [Oscillochloris trichoides DG-6]|uniref:Di-heme Cytochrome-c peroxidase n=1 Tax=Oscillochloris trichoides DG-6 TaxID=765420 RepID=E1IGW3_9CHLR|nr:cytochrome c peroxidase [Oscillochloris trichoides]EFO79438.1 di-heme Cytochrome-c peroxidase [Oscillochloris trichoides DG-6]